MQQTISKGFYLGSIIGSLCAVILLSIVSIPLSSASEGAAGLLVLLAFPLLIYGCIMMMVLLHKMWSAIQSPDSRTTPGKAVGFMFIPFFNMYWVFQAYWGWTKDYNAYTLKQSVKDSEMPESLALTICILTVVSMVPFIGTLAGIVNLVLMAIFLNKAIDGVNALSEAGTRQVEGPSEAVAGE